MPWGAVIGAVGSIAGAAISSSGAQSAANKQADAAAAAAAQNQKNLQPWLDAGTSALSSLSAGNAAGGQFQTTFNMSDAQNSQAEQFALQQGLGAINSSAAAQGGLLGTNNQEQNTTFAENTASQFENQAFNQWLQNRDANEGGLQSLAGQGQTTATNVGATNANAILAAGGAQAGAQIAQTNAYGGALSNIFNSGSLSSTLGGLFGSGSNNPNSLPNVIGNNPYYTDPSSIGAQNGMDAGGGWNPSDVRLKKDLVHVGETNDGTPIYRFRMKSGGSVKMGVLAQDVEKTNPGAVSTHRSGYKMVDYSQVS